jgi:hypothetical protein
MAETPERKVKKKAVEALKALGAYYFYPVTGGFGGSGVPDIIGCYNGRFFGIECKANGNKPTALQEMNLLKIKAQGGIALVIDESNVETLKGILENALRDPAPEEDNPRTE